MKLKSLAECDKIYEQILDIPLADIKPVTYERVWLDTFAKLLRPVFKSLGLSNRKVSVVVPDYSMVSMIQVQVPDVDWLSEFGTYRNWTDDQMALVEKTREKRYFVQKKIEQIILRAFPKNGDRSDVMTDYFDCTFTTF